MKLLFVSDTHLGYDLPTNSCVEKRCRGEDFFRNFERVLEAAVEERVDLVLHGGDLFSQSSPPAPLVERVYDTLLRFVSNDIPLYIVPGNHEHSQLPPSPRLGDPRIQVFTVPQVFHFQRGGAFLALAGFPFNRQIDEVFGGVAAALLEECGEAQTKLLCCHQLIEGASVGPTGYSFRLGSGVVPQGAIDPRWTALCVGHTHRAQLFKTSKGVPVILPGSIERTSFAEINETKGFYLLEFNEEGGLERARFRELPTRPMVRVNIPLRTTNRQRIGEHIKKLLDDIEADAIVKLDFNHHVTRHRVTSQMLQAITPNSMNVQVKYPTG